MHCLFYWVQSVSISAAKNDEAAVPGRLNRSPSSIRKSWKPLHFACHLAYQRERWDRDKRERERGTRERFLTLSRLCFCLPVTFCTSFPAVSRSFVSSLCSFASIRFLASITSFFSVRYLHSFVNLPFVFLLGCPRRSTPIVSPWWFVVWGVFFWWLSLVISVLWGRSFGSFWFRVVHVLTGIGFVSQVDWIIPAENYASDKQCKQRCWKKEHAHRHSSTRKEAKTNMETREWEGYFGRPWKTRQLQ